jgi:hypothetical protein
MTGTKGKNKRGNPVKRSDCCFTTAYQPASNDGITKVLENRTPTPVLFLQSSRLNEHAAFPDIFAHDLETLKQ